MPKLLYQGHGSFRLTADDGRIIYVDPYAGGKAVISRKTPHSSSGKEKGDGYDAPADIILVTHDHNDHNQIHICFQKQNCRVITAVDALANGKHNGFNIGGIYIQAVEAKNFVHNPKKCVGYLITIDGIKLYAAGDTSKTVQMESFAALSLDYALFPGDGIFNMGLKEAAECARLVGAKNNIIIHLQPGALFNRKKADKWGAPNKLIIEPGEEIVL